MQKPYSGWSSAPGSTKGANSVPPDPLADEEGAPAPLSLSALRDSLLAQNKRLSQGRRQVKICGVDRHGEREPITGVWRQNPQRGPGSTPLPRRPVTTRRICINFRSDLWQKWGGHVHPSPVHPVATPLDFAPPNMMGWIWLW